MIGDRVIINGELHSAADLCTDPDRLLTRNYIYQNIHVGNYQAQHLPAHIEIASHAYASLFESDFPLTEQALLSDIKQLLHANSYREMSYVVRLYLFSDSYMLSCRGQLLYRGYVMWHSRLKAITTHYENPLPGIANASSLICGEFAIEIAKRSGAEIALTENYDHILTGAGDNPLFAVRDGVVSTTPLKYGAIDSVERRMGIQTAMAAGYKIEQQPLTSNNLESYDELFFIDQQGIVPLHSCNGVLFLNVAADQIALHLTNSF